MVHWTDIPTQLRDLLSNTQAPFKNMPWVEGPNLVSARVAIERTGAPAMSAVGQR